MHYLADYQTFENKYEMNDAVAEHLTRHKYDLSETELDVLTVITRHAVKYPGAAHLKVATIMKAVDKSEATVRRSIRKLAKLGIVKKVATTRKVSGGYGANLLVIQPFDQSALTGREEAEKPSTATLEASNDATEPYISLSSKNHVLDTKSATEKEEKSAAKESQELPKETLKKAIPEQIFNAISPFFNSVEELYDIIGILFRSKASIDRNVTLEDHTEDYIEAFNRSVFAYKRGKVKNLQTYLFGAWQSATSVIKRRQVAQQPGSMAALFAEQF